VGEPEPVQQRVRVEGVAVVGGDEAQHLPGARARVHAAGLQHDADPGVQGFRVAPRVEAQDAYSPAVGGSEAFTDFHRRRLPGAVRPDDRCDGSCRYR
jgi:hypothetical protein